MLTEVTVTLPPFIAGLDYTPSPAITKAMEHGERAVIALDVGAGRNLASLGQFLLRTESVASSKIEYIDAGVDDYARAMAGLRSNDSATTMVAGTKAITGMIDRAGTEGRIDLGQLLDAHRVLMADDPLDGAYAGRLRDVQNWIGGSDHSPRGAIHVPPPPDTVDAYMTDLIDYANRDDVPVLAQAAVVHAQFESIHPFTDGNGRIGRGLINAVLRRRGFTTTTVVPIASAMLAHRQRYFDLVNDYRTGALHPFVSDVARSAAIASDAATVSAAALAGLPGYWATLSKPRRGSTAAAVLDLLLDHPVINADDAAQLTGAKSTAAYEALARLENDGVVHEVTARRRDRVWAASAVLGELDNLSDRIAAAVRAADRAS
jgi:Fic family protein